MQNQVAMDRPRKSSWVGELQGPRMVDTAGLPGGIGARFFHAMEMNSSKVHHLTASTGETETKNSVRSKAIKVAAIMQSRGVKEGHIIILCSSPHMDHTIALLACWFAGAIVAPIHADLVEYEDLKYNVKMLQPTCAICGTRSSKLINRILYEIKVRCVILCFDENVRQFPIFKRLYETNDEPKFNVTYIAEPKKRPAVIMCTLGTENNPKLVAVSHYSLFLRYSRLLPRFNNSPDSLVSFFPVSCTMHILASCICFDSPMRLVYVQQFSEKSICKHVQTYKIAHAFIDGELALKVAEFSQLTEFNLNSLKTIMVAGMPLSTTNFAKVCNAFPNAEVSTTYQSVETGMMTEVTGSIFTTNKDKVLSVGTLYAGINVRVVDVRTKKILGPDQSGEIQVKGPAVMIGYYRDPETTNQRFIQNFFKTGDFGSYDIDGYIYVKGRLSNHVQRGNNYFALEDVEDVIKLNPAVADVTCININGDITACVIKKPGQDIKASTLLWYIADVLPPHKTPTKLIFKDKFPKNVLGVVKKYIIKEALLKEQQIKPTNQ